MGQSRMNNPEKKVMVNGTMKNGQSRETQYWEYKTKTNKTKNTTKKSKKI